ncbi:MAG: hypothetical protein AB7E60_02660 [Sphingobium sp.]
MIVARIALGRLFPAGLAALSVAGCGTGIVAPQPGIAPAPGGPAASAFARPGALAGMDARRLTQLFGTPRLDIRESSMRKLQFANGRCVLDAYLYPPSRGKEPVVTHADARSPAGVNVDQTACVAALQSR